MSGARGWSEASLHRWLCRRFPNVSILAGSPMHDAACLRAVGGRPTLCTDQTLERVHFEPTTAGRRIGHKAVARVLSDLAASAAQPYAVTLAIAAPGAQRENRLRTIIEGVAETAEAYGARLVAGDLAQSVGPLSVCVTGFGTVAGRRRPVGRDRARAGDALVLSGPVGGSLLGRHLRIEPRVELGRALHAAGARGMMDVSDGLALDLSRLAEASNVALELDLERVPIHKDAKRMARRSGRTPLEHALCDGEDHELIATLPMPKWKRLGRRGPFANLVRIGRVSTGKGLRFLGADEELLRALEHGGKGWIHGAAVHE